MKDKQFIILIVLFLTLAGCETLDDNTKKGAGIGALTGAALGGIIGHQDGHGWEGALIGGAAGAVGGGLIGRQMEKKQMVENPSYIPLTKIAELAKSGVPSDVIIDEIKQSRSVYSLTAEMIEYLKENDVQDKVIDYMLETDS
ncbi:MAG: glycine zipper 2TM domain-containing protein [Candidatus Omnitrophica bacterium]|nr:glycine zipper 2TM domain-containing protein [Candidatus Omnitrophota bacterium]